MLPAGFLVVIEGGQRLQTAVAHVQLRERLIAPVDDDLFGLQLVALVNDHRDELRLIQLRLDKDLLSLLDIRTGLGETSLQGIFFNPNIPTEECFISPMRGVAEGIVYATKPLSYQGQLIDGFWIRFHEGKAVEWHAEQNNELLTKLIEMDEGSRYLGECALVPLDDL